MPLASCLFESVIRMARFFGCIRLVLSGSMEESPSGMIGYLKPAFTLAISLRATASRYSSNVDPASSIQYQTEQVRAQYLTWSTIHVQFSLPKIKERTVVSRPNGKLGTTDLIFRRRRRTTACCRMQADRPCLRYRAPRFANLVAGENLFHIHNLLDNLCFLHPCHIPPYATKHRSGLLFP